MPIHEMIDINDVLQALDSDMERRLSIAHRLEPILREVAAYYGVPSGNWHSFGIVFRLDGQENGQAGMEVGSMALRTAGAHDRQEGNAVNVHRTPQNAGPQRRDNTDY